MNVAAINLPPILELNIDLTEKQFTPQSQEKP
jgi:hypothetical protein